MISEDEEGARRVRGKPNATSLDPHNSAGRCSPGHNICRRRWDGVHFEIPDAGFRDNIGAPTQRDVGSDTRESQQAEVVGQK